MCVLGCVCVGWGWIKSDRHLWLFRGMELFQDPDWLSALTVPPPHLIKKRSNFK